MASRFFIYDKTLGEVVEVGKETVESPRKIAEWPLVSFRGGCNPDQVPDANARLKRDGIIGVEYQKNGDVKWDNPLARRRHLKWAGQYDRSGYD